MPVCMEGVPRVSKGPMGAKACREASLAVLNLRRPGIGREQQ